MAEPTARTASPSDKAARERRLDMQHLQAMEGNPLTAEEIAMFEMFEREGWSEEEEHAFIVELIRRRAEMTKTGDAMDREPPGSPIPQILDAGRAWRRAVLE